VTYSDRTIAVRWNGATLELGTFQCPADPTAEGAETAFMAEALLMVEPCFKAFDAEMPPQPKFLLVIRSLVGAYVQNGRDAALEDRLATLYMKMYWETWCKLMDPEGKLGTPPPAPAMN
jgi:hypothetical protein